ncbi:MAG: PKD domain-containing protein, partial [Candidatus Competibacteraceae bacterium]|nr:PKD domain-containing protein [Candidatus Competibacteraceae bacterium]
MLVFCLCITISPVFGGQATLAWDANNESNLGGYRLYLGKSSRNYTSNINIGLQTSYTVSNLQEGQTYFFAVTAYDTSGTIESNYSNEVSKTIAAPVVLDTDFTASPRNGEAPLVVHFADSSTGITGDGISWEWNFGDGSIGNGQTTSHTYQNPGNYSVSLTVKGPHGSDTETKTGYINISDPLDDGPIIPEPVTDGQVGVFRNGTWFLDFNGNGLWDGCIQDGGQDACLFKQLRCPGDLPVAGDWNGNNTAKVGVYRKGSWFLDFNGNDQWDGCAQDGGQDACLFNSFGAPNDLPVAGDWNGDGMDAVGVYRDGTWFLDTNGNGLWDGCIQDGGQDACLFNSFGA